jgi:gliding motility-associated-like protein
MELANKPRVKFRFTFGSGTTCNDYDGFAFDDFTVGTAPAQPVDFSYTCTGNLQLTFSDIDAACHDNWNWDFGDPGSGNNSSSAANPTHVFNSGGTFDITLKTSGACAVDTSVLKQINFLSASATVQEVSCAGSDDGKAEVFTNSADPAVSYVWSHDPAWNVSTANGLPVGYYTVTVAAPGTCPYTLPFEVKYGPDAFPRVNLGNDTVICPGSVLRLHPGKFTRYLWQDNSVDSEYAVLKAGKYFLRVTNSSGCTASDTLEVAEDCLNDILVPSAFTPNGDGINDFFFVLGSRTTHCKLSIFNRWGELIYSSENREEGWDGTVRGKGVQEGFYNYLVDYELHGIFRNKKGAVYIYR